MAEDNKQPWERMQGESSTKFAYFEAYRNLPPTERSTRAVAEMYGKNSGTIEKYCTEFEWVKRVEAWDDEQTRIARIEQQKEIAEMRKRHANLAKDMLSKAQEAIDKMNPDEMKPQDISRIAEVASKLERLSLGDVGEVIEERDGGVAEPPVTFYIPENNRDKKGD